MGEVQLASIWPLVELSPGQPQPWDSSAGGRSAKFEVVPFLELCVWTIFPQNALLLLDPTSGRLLTGIQEP